MRKNPDAKGLHPLVTAILLCCFLEIFVAGASAQEASALSSALSAGAAGRGGTTAAELGSPLDAAQGNPAGAGGVQMRSLDVSGIGELASGSFQNSVDTNGKLTGRAGALPYAALVTPLGSGRVRAIVAFTPDMLMRANWSYIDPPGTAGVSYGQQKNESEIIALRTSAGAAFKISPKWSAGAELGWVYNINNLNAPYIFQQQTQLAGLKVLLNLRTTGYGWNGSAGTVWQPSKNVNIGASWKSSTYIVSHGTASGSASALFTALSITASPTYQYAAEVDNHLPQVAALGISWQANPKLRLLAQGDWTNWGHAFQQLPVKLTNGTNATINSVVGANQLQDEVALHWHDQGAFRLGAELPIAKTDIVRFGYAYMTDPVPSSTLTPLTAAILQNSLAAGVGTIRGRWHWDLAYQAQLPSSRSVVHSSLLAGEYNNSHVRVMTQSVVVSARRDF